ncbi:hypothetical protein N752_28240 [Desulforamulus aquiferis]|nr:DNA/RNA nuclease SfsA [Desulforamulus aquiferis]RYD01748.1 hypothetical protein N752_28240 [Desulforamulus aquiferis]
MVDDGLAKFPDAPSQRGAKHLRELAQAAQEGFRSVVLFVIQRDDAICFSPNQATDPFFTQELYRAKEAGVEIYALSCLVNEKEVAISKEIRVTLKSK